MVFSLLSTCIGEIGGQLGLFVGVSILTICEIMEAIIVACLKKRKNSSSNGCFCGDVVMQKPTDP